MHDTKPTEGTRLRPIARQDLELVLAWRNHPDIRRFMYTQHEITLQEHLNWFESTLENPRRRAFVFELSGHPSGFVNFSISAKGGIADWGFYAAPGTPRGTGSKLGETALRHAYASMRLHKVCGQALAHNERSIRFHERLGFRREGTLRDQHFDGAHYHSVVCFGLLAHEWQPRP